MLRKRLLLWLVWFVLTVVFSSVAILYQVSRSIPNFLPTGRIQSLGLRACIGAIQGLVGNYIMPAVAGKVTREKTCLYDSFQPGYELLSSHCHHHVPGHRMSREMGDIVEALPKQ